MVRVLIRNSDGMPLEMQSGDAPLGTLTQNAVNGGVDPSTVTEQYMDEATYRDLVYNKRTLPAQQVRQDASTDFNMKKDALIKKLNLTPDDLDVISTVLKGGIYGV